MKTRILSGVILLFVLVIAGCGRYVDPNPQVPEDIIETVPCPTLYERILELFPEHLDNRNSVLFNDTVQKNVVLTKDSELFVTYITEGAGYRNTFGWYSYNKETPPSSASELELHVLFPDVSYTVLSAGNRLKLKDEKFTAGTVIGFFLIIGGWQEDHINYDQPKVYTDYSFNGNSLQQHILFEEKTCGDIVLAFEDLAFNGTSDGDFNDIIFTVSDNNSELVNTAFDKSQIVSW